MKIEIGKTYELSAKYKKSVVELNFFNYTNTDVDKGDLPDYIIRETGWRSGSFRVMPMNEDEVLELETYLLDGDDADELEVTAFEEFEFLETYDGCWEEWRSLGDNSTEAVKNSYEAFCEDEDLREDYWTYDSYLEGTQGYDLSDSEYYIIGALELSLVDDRDVVTN